MKPPVPMPAARSLLPLLFGLAAATADAREPTAPEGRVPPHSPTEPGYEVLLPDPEPETAGDGNAEGAAEALSEVDIASRVLSAAKQVTTVQEAPAIITVITADELQSRGFRTLNDALATIPGWLDVLGIGHHLGLPLVRGTAQAALLLRDGVSMFEPVLNAGQFNRAVPLETIKRVEVVTGPGGVLWGANSFLGIINTISKEAEDVEGLEGAVGYGDGAGGPQDFRAWLLFGRSFKLPRGPRLRVLQHLSYENYLAPRQSALLTLYRSPAPLPAGPVVYGPLLDANPERSYVLDLDGRIGYGPLTLSYAYPLGEMNNSLSFGNTLASGPVDPMTRRAPSAVRNRLTVLDRYVVLQYKDRFLQDRLGLDLKVYGIEFERDVAPVTLPGSLALPTGLSFHADVRSYRVGGTFDGDLALPRRNRLLFGGEAFHEWVPRTDLIFPEAQDPQHPLLPLACPLDGGTLDRPVYRPGCPLRFIAGTSRTVLALYLSDQFRPLQSLVLDAGVRYQAGLGDAGYKGALLGDNGQLLGSASVVWNFWGDMHLKANYATGFRAPVFNNTHSNGAAVQFSGNPDLTNERSQAFQGEWNARLLRNIAAVRELQLRADYSYTQLDSLIVISNGSYSNLNPTTQRPTRRGIHSVEAAARLYLRDHSLSLGYTFLHVDTDDRGRLRSMPQHWFTLGAVIAIVPGLLDANGTLNVIGGYDDPNRFRSTALPDGSTAALFSDLTFDRLPPRAVLNLGLRARFLKNRLWASANVYNALDQRAYYPDVFYDLTPTLEVTPTPTPGWSFFLQVGGKPWSGK